MNEYIESEVVALYDQHIGSAGGEAVKSSEAKAAIHASVVDLIRGVDRDLNREADMLLERIITPTRQRRSRSLKENLEHLLDGFEEGGGSYIDPLLDMAYPLGEAAGLDKPLRYWSPEDFKNVAMTRFRGAAKATEAAAELDHAVQRIVVRMAASSAATLGEVEW